MYCDESQLKKNKSASAFFYCFVDRKDRHHRFSLLAFGWAIYSLSILLCKMRHMLFPSWRAQLSIRKKAAEVYYQSLWNKGGSVGWEVCLMYLKLFSALHPNFSVLYEFLPPRSQPMNTYKTPVHHSESQARTAWLLNAHSFFLDFCLVTSSSFLKRCWDILTRTGIFVLHPSLCPLRVQQRDHNTL